VFVVLTTDRTERVQPGAVLESSRGPLVIEASRPHQHGWIVQVEGVRTRNEAEDLHGLVLLAPRLDDPDAVWVHELIGARVVDVHGAELGTVESVEDNPAADLLVLGGGGLIPMTFVVSNADGVVTVDIPEGLLDL
jgi:16S rRNA processing protein RimM